MARVKSVTRSEGMKKESWLINQIKAGIFLPPNCFVSHTKPRTRNHVGASDGILHPPQSDSLLTPFVLFLIQNKQLVMIMNSLGASPKKTGQRRGFLPHDICNTKQVWLLSTLPLLVIIVKFQTAPTYS
ncbi:hypothetical protein PIB30_028269 [Stylosanthes scabra]|uniref:Uncharacterized protein n=1 Tax=Stylosanthes scabra TaxID=79078 RepID=A0ABU6WD04_9FABA|nr:hypothetical protein [Stylosanthes scabra]